jgi:serine/threonine protein kinase
VSANPPNEPPERTSLADYQLLGRLDDGGGGVQYRAVAPARLGQAGGAVVVVKILEGTPERAFDRLSRMLQTFAALTSPYLVPLLDAGQDGDVFFTTFPDRPGGTLLRPTRPLGPAGAASAVAQAARGAHALHEAGIAHRDISPGAVLLHDDGAWLGGLDLARAAAAGGSVTSMGSLHSVGYVDPAFIKGEPPSRATDLYSLAATLHLALTGVPIHPDLPETDSMLAVRRVLRDAPTISPALDADARDLIVANLGPDPTRRLATAEAFAEQVDALVERLHRDEGGH